MRPKTKPRQPRSELADELRDVAAVLTGWTVRGDGVGNLPRLLDDAADEIERLSESLEEAEPPNA